MPDAKIKVLFLISSLTLRGAEKMLINVVNRFDLDRFSVFVVSLSSNNPIANQLRSESLRFLSLPRKWRYDMRPALEMRKLIVDEKITKIVAFDIFTFFYVWFTLLNLRPRPMVFISIHNIRFKNFRYWVQNLIYARLLSGRERFLAVCDAQANYWSRTYLIPRRNFSIIYNGVDTELFCPSNDPGMKRMFRKRFNIPQEAFVVLQVASLTAEKRHEDALLALKYVADDGNPQPIFLVFVGAGSQEREDKLRKMAHDLEVFEHVLFLGAQSDVRSFYEIADLFALTSTTETFSVAALEAMSMGLPCVLTDVGGAREMIIEAVNGYLVQPNKPIRIAQGWMKAYENRNGFNSQKIRDHVIKCFSLTNCVHKYEDVIKA